MFLVVVLIAIQVDSSLPPTDKHDPALAEVGLCHLSPPLAYLPVLLVNEL